MHTINKVPCSYSLKLKDDSTIGNLAVFKYDNIEYSTNIGDHVIIDFCSIGEYTVIHETYNVVDCVRTLLTTESFEVTVNEYKPQLEVDDVTITFEKPYTYYVSSIELNSGNCGAVILDEDDVPIFNPEIGILTAKVYAFNNETIVWDLITTYEYEVIEDTPLVYPVTFIPLIQTKYKIEFEFTNCCLKIKRTANITVKDAVYISDDDCEKTITNYTDVNIEFLVSDKVLDKKIDKFTLAPDQSKELLFTEDSVYEVKWCINGVDYYKIINRRCEIDACYQNFQKILLCDNTKKKCCSDSYLDSRLATIQSYYQTYDHLTRKYEDPDKRYFEIGAEELVDFQEIGMIRDLILEVCEVCRNNCKECFKLNKTTCS